MIEEELQIMKRRKSQDRRGAVTVEFALIAPLFVAMFIGMTQVTHLMQAQNQFAMAAREGARTAMHERTSGEGGPSTNDKMIKDVRNFLNANGLPGDDVDVIIADANDENIDFDLDDPNNEYEYFQLIIEYAAKDLITGHPPGSEEFKISARVVFRNGKID